MKLKALSIFAAAAASVALAACEVTINDGDAQNRQAETASPAATAAAQDPLARQRAQARAQAQQPFRDLNVLVDISDRKVRLFNGRQPLAEYDAAVGSEEWPTPTGEWAFHRVDINPEWVPPKNEEWAKDEETKAPGAPDNPMGRARLVYRMPNTIHGTDDMTSLGAATSHGSIRVANPVALKLAEVFLKAGGAWDGDAWFQQMVQNRAREYQIPLGRRIPIKVQD